MGRKITSAPIRLDITGLEPRIFGLCKQRRQEIIEQRGKGSGISSSSSEPSGNIDTSIVERELALLPKDTVETYGKIVSVAVDFERAYGRNVYVRIFEHSSNRFLNLLFTGKSRGSAPVPLLNIRPTFSVNGVRVFVGIPNSFSELDEAIDRAFGRGQNRMGMV